jgi:hypothetical protein
MCTHAKFDLFPGLCEISTAFEVSKVSITLNLCISGASRAYPISGFPRMIMAEESLKGESQTLKVEKLKLNFRSGAKPERPKSDGYKDQTTTFEL